MFIWNLYFGERNIGLPPLIIQLIIITTPLRTYSKITDRLDTLKLFVPHHHPDPPRALLCTTHLRQQCQKNSNLALRHRLSNPNCLPQFWCRCSDFNHFKPWQYITLLSDHHGSWCGAHYAVRRLYTYTFTVKMCGMWHVASRCCGISIRALCGSVCGSAAEALRPQQHAA